MQKEKGSLTEAVAEIFLNKATDEDKARLVKKALKLANDVADGKPNEDIANEILYMAAAEYSI